MKTDPGVQTVMPWFEGQQELAPCEPSRREFITVPDGFNGATVRLNPNKIVKADCSCVMLRSIDNPTLLRWVRRSEYDSLVFGEGA